MRGGRRGGGGGLLCCALLVVRRATTSSASAARRRTSAFLPLPASASGVASSFAPGVRSIRPPSLRGREAVRYKSDRGLEAARRDMPKRKKPAAASAPPVNGGGGVLHIPPSVVPDGLGFDRTRTRVLTPGAVLPRSSVASGAAGRGGGGGPPCVVCWIVRDVRARDNWALILGRILAERAETPLRVAYALPPPPEEEGEGAEAEAGDDDGPPPDPAKMRMPLRHGRFLLDGLKVFADDLAGLGVPFDVLRPPSPSGVGEAVASHCLSKHGAIAVVTDMSPLRRHRQWAERGCASVLEEAGVPLYQVDAHNIVPVWMASPKREVGARTLRPKINKLFARYCTHFPDFGGNDHLEGEEGARVAREAKNGRHDWDAYERYLRLDDSVRPVEGMAAGHDVAMARFRDFCSSKQHGLRDFDKLRNDPNVSLACSNLSPWINRGHVSFQRLALDVRALKKHPNGTAAYIEEGVVRRELSDNYVYYTPDGYDSLEGAAGWARDSLEIHASDRRERVYTWRELERAETHDDLWNAAQLQLTREGGMHGFMRMYWAKKILEWTPSPSYALAAAQYLNDRHAYDGSDPNGFVGVGWSVMGVHDMGWKERPVFGKVRYMNYAGCKRKFKVDRFVARHEGAAANAAAAGGGGGGTKEKASGKKQASLPASWRGDRK